MALDIDVSSVSANAFSIKNTGNVTEKYDIKGDTLPVAGNEWGIASAPGWDEFTLQAVFHPSKPAEGQFLNEDIIYSSSTACGDTTYSAGSQTGINVEISGIRTLWHRFQMPLQTTTTVQQKIRLTISAEEN